MITRLIYWLIKVLLSLLTEETGGKSPERIAHRLEVAESDLQDAAQFAYSMDDEARGKRYAKAIVNLWVIRFEVKQITQARVRLPRIRVVWPVAEKS